MKKKILTAVLLLTAICVLTGKAQTAQAEDLAEPKLPEIDYEEIDDVVEELLGRDDFSFRQLMDDLASGNLKLNGDFLKKLINEGVFGNLKGAKGILTQILILSVLSAMFTMLASVFGNGQVSDIGFYVVFLILLALLMSSFSRAAAIAAETVEKVLAFVKVMMPAYMLIVAAAGGGTTAVIFYEFFLFLVFLVDWVILKLLLPLIRVYVILGVVNHISKEDLFSKTAELIKTLIQWSLKSIIGLVIGFQLIQALIAPFIDSFKSAAIHKTLMSIPGVGNAINGVTEMAIGAGILIKNGMGAAALVILVLVCLTPAACLGIYVLLYQLSRALIQPIVDKRILKCIGFAREGAAMLLRTLLITCFLFLLSIAVLTASTNIGMG